MGVLVLQFRLDIRYVLDDMNLYEVRGLMEYGYYADKEAWEQTRLLMYTTAQVNSTKKLSPTEMIKFPWESKQSSDAPTAEDIKRLEANAKKYENLI